MGRVYDVKPDESIGERSGVGLLCIINGVPLSGVFRVEFDDDTDQGMATVHSWLMNGDSPVANVDGSESVRIKFRHHARVLAKESHQAVEASP